METRLFANPWEGFTLVHNVVLDEIMPRLSAEGWKVLCVALRQAQDPSSTAGLSVEQFAQLAGIEELTTTGQAVQECLAAGYLVHRQLQGVDVFALNTAFEWQAPQAYITLSEEHERALEALLNFAAETGVEPDVNEARLAVSRNEPEAVGAWIETVRAMTHLQAPERYKTVLARLLDQIPPLPIQALAFEEELETPPGPSAPGEDPAELWQAVLDDLRPRIKRNLFQWLKPTRGLKFANNVLTVSAPNKRTQEWLETGQLSDEIRSTAATVAGRPITLRFVVRA